MRANFTISFLVQFFKKVKMNLFIVFNNQIERLNMEPAGRAGVEDGKERLVKGYSPGADGDPAACGVGLALGGRGLGDLIVGAVEVSH
jgi:hypothetical protein